MIAPFMGLASAVAVQPATAADTALQIVNVHSHQCLAIGNGSTQPGVAAIQWPCESAHLEQLWLFPSGDGVTNMIKNDLTNMCLAIPHARTDAGTPVIQWPCENDPQNPEQKWIVKTAPGSDDLWIVNYHSGLCLAIPGSSTTKGVGAIQWGCEPGQNDQLWS